MNSPELTKLISCHNNWLREKELMLFADSLAIKKWEQEMAVIQKQIFEQLFILIPGFNSISRFQNPNGTWGIKINQRSFFAQERRYPRRYNIRNRALPIMTQERNDSGEYKAWLVESNLTENTISYIIKCYQKYGTFLFDPIQRA